MADVDNIEMETLTHETVSLVSVELNGATSKTLSLVAQLLFIVAAISQWCFGFYAADYYDDTALQERVEISNHLLSTIDFNCH